MVNKAAGHAAIEAEASPYATLDPTKRIECALEMAQEINAQQVRLYALVALLREHMAEHHAREEAAEGGEAASLYLAFPVIELLDELMAESGQQYRLIECLSVPVAA